MIDNYGNPRYGNRRGLYHWLGCTILITLVFSVQSFGQIDSVSIKAATTAYNQFRLEESRALFETIAGSTSYPVCDRVEAMYNLGLQDWKIFRNPEASVRRLKSCLLLNCQKTRTYILLGQIQLHDSHFPAAISFADNAVQASNNESDRLNSFLLQAQIIYEQNLVLAGNGAMLNTQSLLSASKKLKLILAEQPGRSAPAELLIGISLLLKNGPDVFYAWKSYYFIGGNSEINPFLLSSYDRLNALLPIWNKRELSKSERENLTLALAASQFYDYAYLLAEGKISGKTKLTEKPEIKRILEFEKYIKSVQHLNDIYYPRIAAGLKNYDSSYEISMGEVAKKLWLRMDPRNIETNYTEDDFFDQIEKKFGAEGYMGTTVGYFSMLLGLTVHDELKEINQYGLKATFRYIAVSRLISKDFTTWYGATNVGGWGTDSCIYQVRDAYLQEPFARLNWVTDSNAHKQIKRQIAEARKTDFITCRLDKYKEPGFLSLSIKLNASEQLFDSLQKTGLASNGLYLAFISETMRLNVESTVFAHEGRHAIDQRYFKNEFDSMTQDERELRAKYSEIIFSSKPKLALTGSILGGDLDSNTIHGKANYRLRKKIEDWMELNGTEIKGLDKSIPMLMQVELLSDQQLREICLSADPLSKTNMKRSVLTRIKRRDLSSQ